MHNSHSWHGVPIRMAGVAILAMVSSLLAGCALPWTPAYSSSSSFRSYPAPIPFVWTRVTPAPATPQQAFAAGMSQLRLCFNGPARASTTTWLVAGPTYGVALARGNCSNDSQDQRTGIAILPIALDKSVQPHCPAWVLESSSFGPLPNADANLGQMAYNIPQWLPLPRDMYVPGQIGGGVVPSALFSLESSSRLFISGRFAGSATRPAGAEAVSVGGRSGWQVRDHDIVSVTVPLADGWTFFFSGTADALTMRQLASASLAHLDTLLPKPLPTPTNYSQPTPAC
jgi:hypothetical protein